jgi:UDP-GlcNAc3NAcA epimerase
MKKIVTIIGARPQFVKAAVLSRLMRAEYASIFEECIVHTGQHYDDSMSAVFFRDMMIPEPRVNLGVGSGLHGEQTGEMLVRIERVLLQEKPACVLLYGDTNSTLAGGLAAAKLGIPVAHVEAGLRSFNRRMPEELNRVVTDHLSTFLYCPTEAAAQNLAHEGIQSGRVVGDVMYDASLYYRRAALSGGRTADTVSRRGESSARQYLLTLHRAENTDDPQRLRSIVEALNSLPEFMGVFLVHPRTRKALERQNLEFLPHVRVVDPVGFLEMIRLEQECDFVVTDSGGVQKEAYFFRKPCITLRDETEWVETVQSGWNILAGADPRRIRDAFRGLVTPGEWPAFYGSGNAGQAILGDLATRLTGKEERP